jgi:hypothetical protein
MSHPVTPIQISGAPQALQIRLAIKRHIPIRARRLYGSSDSDSFTFDPNTGRMTGYTFSALHRTLTAGNSSISTDVFESTPHSSGYYHTTASYWPTGALETLSGVPGVPVQYYGTNSAASTSFLDGEGRYLAVNAASGTDPATGVSYSTSSTTNFLGALTGVTYVNGKTDAGTLTWNPNGTLAELAINDQVPGTSDTQTCTYAYDDLARVAGVTNGTPGVKCLNGSTTVWSQTFTYDAFGNVTKNGSATFIPTYSTATNQFTISGETVQYDGDGNMLTDNLGNKYTWDPNCGISVGITNMQLQDNKGNGGEGGIRTPDTR